MKEASGTFVGNIVHLPEREIFHGELQWQEGVIAAITLLGPEQPRLPYLIPGFVDSHLHVESSMLPPAEFARQVVCHGSVAAVCDPHGIANVMGEEGVHFMIENARCSPFKLAFGVPPCVPTTPFETAGAELGLKAMERLFREPEVTHMAEIMNLSDVLFGDCRIRAKLELAKRLGKPVDGHAPGLRGDAVANYAASGISTDHECTSLEEAQEKIDAGMHILIREGSAARNFDVLHPLISSHPEQVMLCSDDIHPGDLFVGHINLLAARAVAAGHDPLTVLQCACLNPVLHYRLPVGLLHIGEPMDGVVVADLRDFHPMKTWIDGCLVAEEGKSLLASAPTQVVNHFVPYVIDENVLRLPATDGLIRVIEVSDDELITHERLETPRCKNGLLTIDLDQDLLWLIVVNRYRLAPPAVAFVSGFGLKKGAIASSVAHNSHNVVAVGVDATALCGAVNAVMASHGGIAVATSEHLDILQLPIAGLMSNGDAGKIGERYATLDRAAKALGSPLRAPFMALSFMTQVAMPDLRLSDLGLFDSRNSQFTELMVPRVAINATSA